MGKRLSGILRALVVGIVLVLVLFAGEHARSGGGKLIHTDWMVNLLWLAAPLILIVRNRDAIRNGKLQSLRAFAPVLILFGCMLLFLFSGAVRHPWSFFLRWIPGSRPDGASGMLRFVLLTSLLLPFVLTRKRGMRIVVLAILLLGQAACWRALMLHTGGAALYSDDHPSFLFRLWEFGRTFPRLVTYNPYWNAGVVNFVGTTSGTGAIGIPLLPLWRVLPVHLVYTQAVALVYIVFLPWIAVASLRILRAGWTAALCAGILALGVSQQFFLWMLHFGTVGAVFAASFVLPVSACVFRIVCLRERSWRLFAALVISVLFLLQWPPGALMAAPIALSMLLCWRRWSRRSILFLVAAAGLVLLLYLRPLLTILLQGNRLMGFVMEGPHSKDHMIAPAALASQGWQHLVAYIHEGHPILIFLGLAGIFVLPHRRVRRWYWPILLAFVLVTGWGPEVKPNLQLGRMAIPMFFTAVIPAALLCSRLLRTGRLALAPVRAALLALLALGAWNVTEIYADLGPARYSTLPPRFRDFAEWIRTETPPDGRIVFAGKTVHFYGRGHIAYLPRLTEREMMADDYYAFPVGMIEYNYPPKAFRGSAETLFRFMDLYNVTHVVTYIDLWKGVFRRQPDLYEEIDAFHDLELSVFRVLRPSSKFQAGGGDVQADFNRIDVRLDDPNAEAVLRYNWADNLEADPPVELFPWDAGSGVRLIGVRPNGTAAFHIRYRSWL